MVGTRQRAKALFATENMYVCIVQRDILRVKKQALIWRCHHEEDIGVCVCSKFEYDRVLLDRMLRGGTRTVWSIQSGKRTKTMFQMDWVLLAYLQRQDTLWRFCHKESIRRTIAFHTFFKKYDATTIFIIIILLLYYYYYYFICHPTVAGDSTNIFLNFTMLMLEHT